MPISKPVISYIIERTEMHGRIVLFSICYEPSKHNLLQAAFLDET